MLIGLVGKPNTGKSTFFNATTLASVPVASYPFTTIEPNVGVAYVRKKCVCAEFGVDDKPKNSYCIGGNRFIPFRLVDTAGLVPGAWKGRGLGNRFLDKVSRADALIHLVDASGATDLEGKPLPPGSHDPLEDVTFLEEELARWFEGIIDKYWSKIVKRVEMKKQPLHLCLHEILSGLNFKPDQIKSTVASMEKDPQRLGEWGEEDLLTLAKTLLKVARPTLIGGNKADMAYAEENVERIREAGNVVFPVSAVSEQALRKASQKKYIDYLPGDDDFEILSTGDLTSEQLAALERIRERVMKRFGGTGVQQILDYAVFNTLNYIAVYPVSDVDSLTDTYGNVLPDAFLLPRGSKVIDLAEKIHSEIAAKIIYAIDARSRRRLSPSQELKDDDVIQIVSAAR
ncbi:MAG: redox-regulated ATPase YchF [Candidatus Geothermarchaeales archaeon]